MRSGRLARVFGVWVAWLMAAPPAAAQKPKIDYQAAWTRAHLGKPMTAAETRGFMKRLLAFIEANHLKKDPNSAQRGMVYEYFDVRRKGRFDQWVQGEGLDTMHDGAWLAAALVNAYRATRDEAYKRFLAQWQMPFYCKMLNYSDELFTSKGATAREGAMPWGKPWAFQEGEKGFVPYWWDDGASVSLERRGDKHNLTHRPCVNALAGKPNPKSLLVGYSLGMSNHMAQDLGVMVELAWLLFRDSKAPADGRLAAEIAQAARNLHECRVRHWGVIPMCAAPAALAGRDAKLMKRLPDPAAKTLWAPGNHYVRCLRNFKRGDRMHTPGFADNQQYTYYFSVARTGGKIPRPLAFRTVYDAYTEPMLFRYYCDDWPVPAGINRFDLYPLYMIDGKMADYRSDRKGPWGLPKPIGSRMGPQNMIVCGWAIQMLRAMPGLWEEPYRRQFSKDLRVYIDDPPPAEEGAAAGGGAAAKARPAEVRLGAAKLSLRSTRLALCVTGSCKSETLTVKIFDRPDAKGTHAAVALTAAGTISAVNDQRQPLKVQGATTPGAAFVFQLPYTIAKGQNPWANGVEHGRYSIQVGKEVRNFYLASPEAHVADRLRHELAGGLRTWEAIFKEKGYIPTGMGRGGDWDHFSDSGGYAHLIGAAAQWLLYLDGRNDWQVHSVPDVLGAK